MVGPETDIAVLVFALVIIPERVTTSFGRLLVKPATRKDTPSGFDAHHCRVGIAVLDRRSAFEASLDPVVDITLARDVVVRNAVVREVDDGILPTAPPQRSW
jgi:hypothetical protein